MPQGKRVPVRTFRMEDDLWARAQAAVKYRGDRYVSHIIRGFLTQYVEDTEKMMRRDSAYRARVPTNRGANRNDRSNRKPRG